MIWFGFTVIDLSDIAKTFVFNFVFTTILFYILIVSGFTKNAKTIVVDTGLKWRKTDSTSVLSA